MCLSKSTVIDRATRMKKDHLGMFRTVVIFFEMSNSQKSKPEFTLLRRYCASLVRVSFEVFGFVTFARAEKRARGSAAAQQ